MADTTSDGRFVHLNPSELGTREYWDKNYRNELVNGLGVEQQSDLTNLDSWFSEIDAPAKVLDFLTSEDFPLSPDNPHRKIDKPAVLDLGCGNGSSLFELKLEGLWPGPMVGVDYSEQSVNLARRLWSQHCHKQEDEGDQLGELSFEQIDFLKEQAEEKSWWPTEGFDLVLDKGTFDAVSLAEETIEVAGRQVRLVEIYPAKAAALVKPGGYLLVTSVNWTEEELVRWFTESTVHGVLVEYGRVRYPVYEYGGHKGQGVVSVCFHRSS